MSTLLELVGQFTNVSRRPITSQKIAEALGAETLLIFIKDDELNILLPAPGFVQTIDGLHSWQSFLATCVKNKLHSGFLYFPDKTTQTTAMATGYKDELVFLLLGGRPDKQKMHEIQGLLPLFATLLKYEQRKSEAEERLKIAEKSLLVNEEAMNKLYDTRHELQLSIVHAQTETEARKISEQELLSEQQRMKALFMQAPAAIAVLQGPDHIFKLANPLYKRLIGGRDPVGKSVRDALPELKDQGIYELLDRVYKTGEPFIGNELMVKHDQKGNGIIEDCYYNFVFQPSRDGQDKVTGILVHAVDVTEQIVARQKAQASEERLRFMSESMPQKVFTALPSGEVDYFNHEWMDFTGLSMEQIRDWGWTQFIHPDDIDENIRRWQHSLDTGEPFSLEHRFRRHDGVYRWHLSRARPMRDDNGTIIRWFGSNTDIEEIRSTTERKQELEKVTKALQRQRTDLIALNKTKDEFIALSSHQLRTPATAVKQYVSLVLDGYFGPLQPDQIRNLQIAYDSNERQLNIINDLLKTAQIDLSGYSLRKEHHVIANLLQEVITELQPNLKLKHQKVILEGKDELSTVYVDSNEMKLVFSNLLENASKYSHQGTAITVKLQKKNQKLMIEIKDTGVGISKDEISRIFEKFTRIENELSDTVAGTGLGLYWVKQIIKLHGGSVKVKSDLGKGSNFIVSLPL